MAAVAVMSHANEVDDLVNLVNTSIANVNTILDELRERYENQLKLQEELMREQNKIINAQDNILGNIHTKVVDLAEEVIYSSHLSTLCDRLIDDNDQIDRKNNLKLEGIEIFENDSPKLIIDFIRTESKRKKVDIVCDEFERAYRVGPMYFKHGTMQQYVLLRMRGSGVRNEFYKNREKFNFFVHPDLTTKRESMLNFAKYEIDNEIDLCVNHQIDCVYADVNCQLKLKTKSGRIYGFSSKSEFTSLITWLNKELCMSGGDAGWRIE